MRKIRAGGAGLAAMALSTVAACILTTAPAAAAATVHAAPQNKPSWIGIIYFDGFGPTPAQAIAAAQAVEQKAGYKGGSCSSQPYQSEYEGICAVSFYIP
jgi:hypothetical protein